MTTSSIISLLCTAIIVFVFLRMAFSYTQKRAHERYADNKQKAPSISSFRHLSKALFVVSMLMTVISYWFDFPHYFQFHDSPILQLAGALWVLFGYIGLHFSFQRLADNYSPLFDAYKPFNLVNTGVYATIRHPIYAFNLCVSFGLALSSGIIIIVLMALIGFGFVLRAVFIEEAYLRSQFDDYATYCKTTWRFIPYVF